MTEPAPVPSADKPTTTPAQPKARTGPPPTFVEWTLLVLGLLVALLAVVMAVIGLLGGPSVNLQQMAVAIAIAAALIVFRDVESLRFAGFEIKKQVRAAQDAAAEAKVGANRAENAAVEAETGQVRTNGPIKPRKRAKSAKQSTTAARAAFAAPPADDPEKRGDAPERDGYRLRARITAKKGDPEWPRVRLWVERAGDQARPLQAPVTFHLHPTFPDRSPAVHPINGVAELRFPAYGPFTAAAEVNEGGVHTRLELDLATLEGGPDAEGVAPGFWKE